MKRAVFSFLFISYFLCAEALAVTILSNNTEASYSCSNGRCAPEAPKSNLLRMCEEMKARAAWADDWQCTNTAIFENGSSPQRIQDLRDKPLSSLTEEEKAILIATDKVGNIKFCNGAGGNAFLIMHQGRPAVITTAHTMFDRQTSKPKCSKAELERASYYPNSSYYDPNNPNKNKDFYLSTVGLEYPPVNLQEAQAGGVYGNDPNANHDFLIFYLKEDITKDQMPAGHQRSYLKNSQNTQSQGQNLYSIGIGIDPGQDKLAVLYQNGCNFNRRNNRLNHDCATENGSSGSLLGHLENGEIKFSGMHRFSIVGNAALPGPSTNYQNMWNVGISSQHIQGNN